MQIKNMKFLLLSLFLFMNAGTTFSQQQKSPANFHALVLAERGGIHEGFVVAALEWLNQFSLEQHFDFHVINHTDSIGPAYRALIGANLLSGFRKRLHDTMGHVRGCTHLTEMLSSLPTAAVQTFAGLRKREDEGTEKPFQLDRCHALETTSDTVRRYYPRWYRGAA